MVYAPKHQKQLNGSATAGEDCWVRSVSMAIDFATRGGQVPSVDAIRNRAGVPGGSGNTADQEKAAESYNTPDETKQRQPVQFDRHVADPWEGDGLPVDAMKNGEKFVVLSIDYGVINERAPGLSGDPNFNGNHSVAYGETRNHNGTLQVKAYDSLYDGRRDEIPNGPQWMAVSLVRDAAAAFAGSGKWTGGIVPTSYKLDDGSEPEPEPTPPVTDAMEQALYEERAALVSFVADAQARIAYVDTILPPNKSAATAVVSSGQSAESQSA